MPLFASISTFVDIYKGLGLNLTCALINVSSLNTFGDIYKSLGVYLIFALLTGLKEHGVNYTSS